MADWDSDEYETSLAHHAAMTQYEALQGYYCRWVGTAMIKITVLDCYDFPPATPELVILPEGGDVRLSWPPVTESLPGCPIDVDAYLVWYAPQVEGPYYFHGYTTDTTYVHTGVVQFADGMFYEVDAYVGELTLLAALPPEGKLTRERVLQLLHRQR